MDVLAVTGSRPGLYLVLDGEVIVGCCRPASSVASLRCSGQFFGEDAVFGTSRYRLAARSVGMSAIAFFAVPDILQLIEREPVIALNLAKPIHRQLWVLRGFFH